MDKITEALSKILPAEHVNEVRKAVEEMMAEQVRQLEAEFKGKLEEAYEELSAEKESTELIAEQGYQQAYEMIGSLMKRLDEQREEFEQALEEGFEEAYQTLQKEKARNDTIEVELYEEFDQKLKEMKEFMVDKVDQFLALQENEIYESAKRELASDPRLSEQKVIVAKMAELLSDYMDSNEYASVSSSKLEEAYKSLEELKGQMRILEAKNVRLNTQNTKLNEHVQTLMTEATKTEKKERIGKAKNASGRGQRVIDEQIVTEQTAQTTTKNEDEQVNEGHLGDILVLSGIQD